MHLFYFNSCVFGELILIFLAASANNRDSAYMLGSPAVKLYQSSLQIGPELSILNPVYEV
jgi:hypothetical protein